MVALAPLPLGSVDFIWIAIWVGVASVAVILLDYKRVTWPVAGLLIANVFVVLAFLLVAAFQSTTPGPLPREIWHQASTILNFKLPAISASVRDAPWLFLGRPMLSALVLCVAIVLGLEQRTGPLILRTVVISSCVYGLIGLFVLIFKVASLRPLDAGNALITFFIYKNTTAIYLGSGALVAFSIVMQIYYGRLVNTDRGREGRRIRRVADWSVRETTVFAAGAIFLLILLPLTQSRAGLILTFSLLVTASAVYFGQFLKSQRRNVFLIISVGILLIALIYGISGESWRVRQAKVGLDWGHRTEFYLSMLTAIKANPWLGMGLGSFVESFPQFRLEETGVVSELNIGHSTPIELAFEGGVPLEIVGGLFVLLCGIVLFKGLRRQPGEPVILSAALVGALGLIHSCIDFSLQIPGYAIIYTAVVGVGLGRALSLGQN